MDFGSEAWKSGLDAEQMKQVHFLEDSVEKLRKEQKQKQIIMDNLEQTMDKHKLSNEELRGKSNDLELHVCKLNAELEAMDGKTKSHANNVVVRENQIIHLNTTIENYKKSNNELVQNESTLLQKIAQLEHEKSELQRIIDKLTAELDAQAQINNVNTKNMNELQAEIYEVEERSGFTPMKNMERSPAMITPKKTPLYRVEVEVERLRAENEKFTQENVDLQQKVKSMLATMECERFNDSAIRDTMEKKFREKETDMRSEITELQCALNNLQRCNGGSAEKGRKRFPSSQTDVSPALMPRNQSLPSTPNTPCSGDASFVTTVSRRISDVHGFNLSHSFTDTLEEEEEEGTMNGDFSIVEKLERNMEDMGLERNKLRDEVEDLQLKNAEYLRDTQTKAESIYNLQSLVNKVGSSNTELIEQLDSANAQLEKIVEEKISREVLIEQLQGDMKQLMCNLDEKIDEIRSISEELDALKKEKDDFEEILLSAEIQLSDTRAERDSVVKDCEEVRDNLGRTEKLVESYLSKLNEANTIQLNLDSAITILKKVNEDLSVEVTATKDELEAAKITAKGDDEELKKEISELKINMQMEMDLLTDENNNFNAKVAEIEESKLMALQEKEDDIHLLEDAVALLTATKSNLTSELEQLNENLQDVERENAESLTVIDKLSVDLENSCTEIAGVTNELSDMRKIVEELKDEKNSLTEKLTESESYCVEILSSKQAQTDQLDELLLQSQTHLGDKDELIAGLRKDIEDVNESLFRASEEVNSLEMEKEQLHIDSEVSKDELLKSAERIEALTLQLENNNAMHDENLTKLQTQKDELEKELLSAKEKSESDAIKFTEKVKSLENEVEVVKSEGNEALASLGTQKDEAEQNLESIRGSSENKILSLNAEIEMLKTQMENNLSKETESLSTLRNEKAELEQNLLCTEVKLIQLTDEKDNWVQEHAKLNENLQSLNLTIQELENEKRSFIQICRQHETVAEHQLGEIQSSKAFIKKLELELTHHKDEVDRVTKLVDKSNNTDEKVFILEEKIIELEEIEITKKELQVEINGMRDELEEKEKALQSISSRKDRVDAELKSMEIRLYETKQKSTILDEENKALRAHLSDLEQTTADVQVLEKKLKEIEDEKNVKATKLQFALNQARKWERVLQTVENEKSELEQRLDVVKEENEQLSLDVSRHLEEYESVKRVLKEERLKVKPIVERCKQYMYSNKKSEHDKKRIREEIQALCKDGSWLESNTVFRSFVEKLKKRVRASSEETGHDATGATCAEPQPAGSRIAAAAGDHENKTQEIQKGRALESSPSKKQPLASNN